MREERAGLRGDSPRALLAMWTGVLGAPLIFLIHLQVGYMLVPLDCTRESRLLAHIASVAGIILATGAGLMAVRTWRRRGDRWPDASASTVSRDRFLGAIGALLSGLSVLTLIAQWIPVFFISPCR